MQSLTLTKGQVRRFLLTHQGLLPPHQLKTKEDVLAYFRRVGCIQFDPLNIVGNNPELVLQARITNFRPQLLRELLYEDRRLVDGWDKNMSIFLVEDWPYFHRRRQAVRKSGHKSYEAVRAILPQVRGRILEMGPLSSIDLDIEGNVDWSWAPARLARAALESMYDWGELVVHHRVHTRRYYDFADRHIEPGLLTSPDPNPSDQEYHDWYLHRRIGAIGLVPNRAGDAWLGMYGMKSEKRRGAFERLLKRGELLEMEVQGIDAPLYMRSDDLGALEQTLESGSLSPQAAILAPLDNLLWDRRLIQTLFDFYYVWEVYKPPKERRFGYYVLPILYGDRFIARFDPGREKESGALIIKNWWWEEGVRQSRRMQTALLRCFKRFLSYLETDRLILDEELSRRGGLGWLGELK